MKNDFHYLGSIEFDRGKDPKVWKSIETKYADKLAAASWLEKLKINFQMQREFSRRRKEGHEPSPETLW